MPQVVLMGREYSVVVEGTRLPCVGAAAAITTGSSSMSSWSASNHRAVPRRQGETAVRSGRVPVVRVRQPSLPPTCGRTVHRDTATSETLAASRRDPRDCDLGRSLPPAVESLARPMSAPQAAPRRPALYDVSPTAVVVRADHYCRMRTRPGQRHEICNGRGHAPDDGAGSLKFAKRRPCPGC
jgi:hypothetical protein